MMYQKEKKNPKNYNTKNMLTLIIEILNKTILIAFFQVCMSIQGSVLSIECFI